VFRCTATVKSYHRAASSSTRELSQNCSSRQVQRHTRLASRACPVDTIDHQHTASHGPIRQVRAATSSMPRRVSASLSLSVWRSLNVQVYFGIRSTHFYPAPGRGTGYCIERFLCLFLCLFLYQQHYEKTAGPICMKFSWTVWSDHGTTWFIFGSIRVNGSAGRRSSCLLSPAIAQSQLHSLGGGVCCAIQQAP